MSKIRAIKCPNCAAPLNLLGGGRVNSIVCSYCNSLIDLNNNYKVVATFKAVKDEHHLPFDIGMKGVIKSVEWTIIGRVDYITSEYPYEEWSDFLLFSELYGYSWLTYDNGHLIYSKRVRDFPLVDREEILGKEDIAYNNRVYEFSDSYDAKVSYVEGELTWVAKVDDRVSIIDMVNPPFGVSIEKSGKEIEYYLSEYLDEDEIYKTFSAQKEQSPNGDNILKPADRAFFAQLAKIASVFIVAMLFVILDLFIEGKGRAIKSFSVNSTKPYVSDFNVTSSKYLVNIELKANSPKSLDNFKIDILKDNKEFYYLDKSKAYRYDSNKIIDSWDSGAYDVSAYINIDKLGKYKLIASAVDSNISSTMEVTIVEQKARLNYIIYFAIFTLIIWFWHKVLYIKDNIEKLISLDTIWLILMMIALFILEIYT